MPLNLEEKKLELVREDPVAGTESYKVLAAHPAYRFIWHVGLSINAMTTALTAVDNEPVPTVGHLSLACKAYNFTVHLPAHSMINDVRQQPVEGRPWIQVSFISPKEPGKNDGWAVGVREWMWLVVGSGFVQLVEEHRVVAHRHNHGVAQMADVIRDACAHGLKIASSKSGGASLGELKISKQDHGKPLRDFVGLGDFFVLALRAFNEPTPHSSTFANRARH